MAFMAGVTLLALPAQAAVIAELTGDYSDGFTSMRGSPNVWNAPGSDTPTSPSDVRYTGPDFWGVFAGTYGTEFTESLSRVVPTEPYLGNSNNAPKDAEQSVLLAPMFLPTAGTFVGSLDTVDMVRRGYGSSGPLEYRIILEMDGTDLYITDALTYAGTGLTNPGAGGWNLYSPDPNPYVIGADAPLFAGSGNITAVGVWLTETIQPNVAETASAGYGIKSLVFNGTAIPQPSSAALSVVALAGFFFRRRRIG